MRYFHNQIAKFFKKLKPDSTLLLTTYSLDEIVLSKLFSDNSVNKSREIMLFCDVRRHKAQGYLKAIGYTNLQICEVILNQTNRKCPVFHPKLWLEISKDFKTAYKVLAGSFNLSEYHFNKDISVLDTVSLIEKSIQIGFAKKLKEIAKPTATGTSRKKMAAFTFVLDLRGRGDLTISTRAAGMHIKEILTATQDDKVRNFCSPFISSQALKKLEIHDGAMGWTGAKTNGVQLHAKCVEARDVVFSGSVNLTHQALWGNGGKPINCEVLVTSHKVADFSLRKICKGFITIRLADNPSDSNPADRDSEDDEWSGDWNEERALKVAAPCSLSLEYNEASDSVEIKIDGKCKPFTYIKLYSANSSENLGFSVKRKNLARLTYYQQCVLAELILSKTAVAGKGFNGRKLVWKKDLDFGEFWLDIKNLPHIKGRGEGGETKNIKSHKHTKKITFDDVRTSREMLLNADISQHCYGRINWLHKHSKKVIAIPRWCFKFAKEIKDFTE